MEKFRGNLRQTVAAALDDKSDWLKRIMDGGQSELLAEERLVKQPDKEFDNSPLKVKSNEARASNFPLYVSGLLDTSTFLSRFGKIKDTTEVGEITIFKFKSVNGHVEYYGDRGSIQKAGFALLKDLKTSLRALARAIETNDPAVANTKYFYGVSRLAAIADKFGFDTFAVNDLTGKDTASHEWAREEYERSGGGKESMDVIEARDAKFAIISREKLLELYATGSATSLA